MENISDKFKKEKSYEGNASVPVHISAFLRHYSVANTETLFKFIYSNEVVLNYQRVRHGLVYGKPTNSMLL